MRKLDVLPAQTPCNARPPVITPFRLAGFGGKAVVLGRARDLLLRGLVQIDWFDPLDGQRTFFLRVASARVTGNVFHPVRGPERCSGVSLCGVRGCRFPKGFRPLECEDAISAGGWVHRASADLAEQQAIAAWAPFSTELEAIGNRIVEALERSIA
jgi:hypothetical protein